MSTISQTPKIRIARIPENRVLNLIVVAACLAMMAAFIASAAVSNTSGSFDQNAYDLYRQGEWLSVPVDVSSAVAYHIFRLGEVASPVTPAEAYQIYRQGEWASAATPMSSGDLSAYHLSERTLVEPQAGMAIYHSSERTSLPVQFNPYQRSEWFGE